MFFGINLLIKLFNSFNVICCSNDSIIAFKSDSSSSISAFVVNFVLFKSIPVFIISGDDSKKTIDKAFTYDIVDMLNKPFTMENIKEAVRRAISLSDYK